jgi:hypothetical protein
MGPRDVSGRVSLSAVRERALTSLPPVPPPLEVDSGSSASERHLPACHSGPPPWRPGVECRCMGQNANSDLALVTTWPECKVRLGPRALYARC